MTIGPDPITSTDFRSSRFGTYKLKYGHRGINQPVQDRATGKVEVSHVCLNDDVVEGLRALDVPAFSVQYHPEAAAGPHDAAPLFGQFVDYMSGGRG